MEKAYKKLQSEYNKFSKNSILILDVNCEEEVDLCQANEILKYPTLKYFVDNGVEYIYEGKRDYESMKNFVEKTLKKKTCDVNDTSRDCSEKEISYIEKNRKKLYSKKLEEKERLILLSSTGKMGLDLKDWVDERIAILEQLLLVDSNGGGRKSETSTEL